MLDKILEYIIKKLIILWNRHDDKLAFSFGTDEHTDYSILVGRYYDTYYTYGTKRVDYK